MHLVFRREVFGGIPIAAQTVDPVRGVGPHGHDFAEIAVVARGTAVHVSGGVRRQPTTRAVGAVRWQLRPGSALVIRPGMWHGYENCRNLAVHNIYVGSEVFHKELSWVREDPRLGPVLWPAAEERAGRQLTAAARDRLSGWISNLRAAGPERGLAWWIAHLLLVLNELAGAGGGELPDERGGTHQAVLRAARLLEDEPARPWTLAELAVAVNLAPSYLVRLFAREVGLPPLAYLARLRAERAAGLLIETDLSIAAIGDRVGWPDPNYMSRRFRACFGQSPSEYRRVLTSSGLSGHGAARLE